jgi:hypothetical protein
MKRWLACSLAGTVATLALISLPFTSGCGGSTGETPEGGTDDTGAPKKDTGAPTKDGGGKDTGGSKKDVIEPFDSPATDGPAESGIPTEGGPTVPAGATQLVNTVKAGFSDVEVLGLTDDNQYAIYGGFTTSGGGLYAVPLTGGGKPITIIASLGTLDYGYAIVHSTVFVWTGIPTTLPSTGNGVGTLAAIWTAKNGVQNPKVTSSVSGLVAASPDSTMVAYTSGASTDGSTADIVVAGSDLSNTQTVLPATVTNNTASTGYFIPQLGFTNNSYFVVTHEETTTATVSFWTTGAGTWPKLDLITGAGTTTGAGTPTLTSAFSWSTSTTGTGFGSVVVAATSAGALQAFALPSATAIPVDTGVTSFLVKPDGTGVLYGTAAGGYNLATLPTPTVPVSILTTGYGGFITGYGTPGALDPTGDYAIYYKTKASSGAVDLNLISNTLLATPTVLLASDTGAVFNDAFTADSKYALYYTSFTTEGTAGAVGDLFAFPVAGGSAITVSKNAVWESNYLSGSKIIYNDNFQLDEAGDFGYADISTMDVSAATPTPTPIIQLADENYFLTTDRVTLVFALNQGNTTTDGLYSFMP